MRAAFLIRRAQRVRDQSGLEQHALGKVNGVEITLVVDGQVDIGKQAGHRRALAGIMDLLVGAAVAAGRAYSRSRVRSSFMVSFIHLRRREKVTDYF